MFTKPWGVVPQPDAEWLGSIGCLVPLDAELHIMGQRIPFPSNAKLDYIVQDYSKKDFLSLKGIARSRRMTEWKQRKKADIVASLVEWDFLMQNTTT